MRRCLQLCVGSALYLGLITAAVAESYGDWTLEQPTKSVLTLSFKRTAQIGNQLTTAELVIVCKKGDETNSLGALLIPFDWLFENQHETVPVLIEKNEDRLDESDILQQWHNASNDYIFSAFKPDIEELISFIKAKESEGVKAVHVFVPSEPEDAPQNSMHIAIGIVGFSQGFDVFQKVCTTSQ